ncbi:S8 family serine peptidase [Brevibacillus borstelensis]|uniref:S8 family serine peptidase n=1 Tax=Brevibacillus borstelensis TaxID=45462 RepID=UPI002E1AEFA0|nr:S8 family serine peptidase [Brevibacillus borstelensis]MED1875481.1 S8 family serine peptidase [Brevibacillus borstelensis]
MKKQVFYIGLSLVLLPSTTAGTWSTKGDFPEAVAAITKQQVWSDLRPDDGQTSPAMQSATHAGTVQSASADEWTRAEHVLMGEQVADPPTSNLDMIEAKKAWEEIGVKGEGMLISVIDTGINGKHPDLPAPRDKRSAQQKSGVAKKVIPGYNWADRNQITEDVGESQHGIHVAGIVAANGKIKGVAPEAQLLSQKVFSNYQGEVPGLSESILFAINDSIAKKADVINLSLGSSAGYVDETNTEQYAVKRAVDNGVIVVAAAGNDAYFGSDKVKAQNPDVSMIGSPGLAPDAFSVASVNATTLAGLSFAVEGVPGLERVVYLHGHAASGQALNPVQALMKQYELMYMGKGKKEDYNVSVKGKVVLLERGDISFDEKLRLAKEKGAAGAVIYNNQPGPLIISAETTTALPAVSILKQTGEMLTQALKKGKKVKINFDGQFAQNPMPYPDGGTVSAFTSWGPTPDLQFKPEIAAPGGGILSLVRETDYAVKSGTSMATPHVAGGMALLKQAYQKQGYQLSGRQLVETMKAAAMNTAQPVLDPRSAASTASGRTTGKVPYSPRVQGAGVMQIAKAIKTPSIITDAKGKAGVSLGEVGETTTFSLFVENKFGKKPVTYQVKDEFGVLTDKRQDGINMLTDTALQGAALRFSAQQVTVQPGQRAEVKVTLHIPKNAPRNIFAEGYVVFQPTDSEIPVLRVPYYGFYGKWDEPRVMDQPMWDPGSQEHRTGVKTTWYHDKENDKWKYRDYLGVTGVSEDGHVQVDPAKIAFSPNGDGHYDVAAPSITFLRNARQVTVDVVDSGGTIIRSLSRDEKISKFDQSKLGTPYYYTEREEWSWDGKKYNPEKGVYETVPDGAYRFVVRARIDSRHANWHTLTLPIKVDTKAPVVTASLSGNKVHWSSRDKDIQGYLLYVGGKKVGGPYSASITSTIVSQPDKRISLVAYDYAGNMSVVNINGKSDVTPPFVQFPNDLYTSVLVTRQPEVAVNGRIAGEDMLDRVRLQINKNPVQVETDGSFKTILKLPEGLNYVPYHAQDMHGNSRHFTQRIIVDTTPPQLQLTNDGSETIWFDAGTKRMLVPVKFAYRDQTYKGQVSINGQIVSSWEEDHLEKAVQKNFTQTLPLQHGENRILLEGKDAAGNESSMTVYAYVDAQAGSLVMHHAEQRYTYQAKPLPAPALHIEEKNKEVYAGESMQISGRVNAPGTVRMHLDYADQHVFVDVNDRGEFRALVNSVKEGKQKLSVVAVDALGRETKAEMVIVGKKR